MTRKATNQALLSYGGPNGASGNRPISAGILFGTTTTMPATVFPKEMTPEGNFWVGTGGGNAYRFNIYNNAGATLDTHNTPSYTFLPYENYCRESSTFYIGSFGSTLIYGLYPRSYGPEFAGALPADYVDLPPIPGQSYDLFSTQVSVDYGGNFRMFSTDGSGTYGTFQTAGPVFVPPIMGNTGIQFGSQYRGVAVGDQAASDRFWHFGLSPMGLFPLNITPELIASGSGGYNLFRNASLINSDRYYLSIGAVQNNIQYYNYTAKTFTPVIVGLATPFTGRGLCSTRGYLWTAQTGAPGAVHRRDPNTGAVLATIALPGTASPIGATPLFEGPGGMIWVRADRMYGIDPSRDVIIVQSDLLGIMVPLGISRWGVMGFYSVSGSNYYYHRMLA